MSLANQMFDNYSGKSLPIEKWYTLCLIKQFANIGQALCSLEHIAHINMQLTNIFYRKQPAADS